MIEEGRLAEELACQRPPIRKSCWRAVVTEPSPRDVEGLEMCTARGMTSRTIPAASTVVEGKDHTFADFHGRVLDIGADCSDHASAFMAEHNGIAESAVSSNRTADILSSRIRSDVI